MESPTAVQAGAAFAQAVEIYSDAVDAAPPEASAFGPSAVGTLLRFVPPAATTFASAAL